MITENEMNRIGWAYWGENKTCSTYVNGDSSVYLFADGVCCIEKGVGERVFKGFIPDIETLMLVLELVGVNYERP